MASKKNKMDNNSTNEEHEQLTLKNVLFSGGAGINIYEEIILCLLSTDIANFMLTSIEKQLNDAWKGKDNNEPLKMVKEHLNCMKKVHLYSTIEFHYNYNPLMMICLNIERDREKCLEDVQYIVKYYDTYIKYVNYLTDDVWGNFKTQHSVENMVNQRTPSGHLKNVIHECIFSYDENEYEKGLIQWKMMKCIYDKYPNTFQLDGKGQRTRVQITKTYALPFKSKVGDGKFYAYDDGEFYRKWKPLGCVNKMRGRVFNLSLDNACNRSLILIYLPCYHWNMDWFYDRKLSHIKELRSSLWLEDPEEIDGMMEKRKQLTARVGKLAFDAAKNIGIINNVFPFEYFGTMRHVTILDLHHLVFDSFRELIAAGGPYEHIGRWEAKDDASKTMLDSYDDAVRTKLTELRTNYGAKRHSELE